MGISRVVVGEEDKFYSVKTISSRSKGVKYSKQALSFELGNFVLFR